MIDTAMVLAAGEGRRLRPLTDRVPKPLVDVGGQPLIGLTLRWLERQGFRRVVVNTHHLAPVIEDWLAAHARDYAMTIAVSHEDTLLGTGGGIHHAAALWQSDLAWVVNGDVVCDVDLRAAERCLRDEDAALLVLRNDPAAAAMGPVYAELDGGCGEVVGLLDSGDRRVQPRMFTGVHLIRRSLAERLPEPSCVVRQGYLPLVGRGELRAWLHDGYWNEIGTPARLATIRADAEAGRLPWAP
jgi:NDP-sugar pyrophosphorylase family protein